jgi:hypothetical protein
VNAAQLLALEITDQGKARMRVLTVPLITLILTALSVAQDRGIMHEQFGPPHSEKRRLESGIEIEAFYAEEAGIGHFSITRAEARKQLVGGEWVIVPSVALDETRAWDVIYQIFPALWGYAAQHLPKGGCCTLPCDDPALYESYRLGDVLITFEYDTDRRLIRVLGWTGLLGPDPSKPPN